MTLKGQGHRSKQMAPSNSLTSNPLWGDKSEYVNPYIPTQTLEEHWSDHMQNHQADSPLYVWPDVWSADLHLFIKNMVIHDIECPYWDQMSLNNTNPTQPNPPWPRKYISKCQDHHPMCLTFKVMVKDVILHNGGQRNVFAYVSCSRSRS